MSEDDLQHRIRLETARRIDDITAKSGAVLKWDRDGDGRLDDEEWSILRTVVEAEVVRELGAADTSESAVGEDFPGHEHPAVDADAADTSEADETNEWEVEEFEDPHMDLPVVEVIDTRYEVLKELGRGSQGQTHLARRRDDGQYVAIKELAFSNIDSWKSLELFDREADVLRALDHAAIPDFVDSFHLDVDGTRRFFLVQEFFAGTSLDVLIARGERLSPPELRDFCEQMLDVLEYLHDVSPPVIHRDVKPSNIIRSPDGVYALVDFGGVQLVLPDEIGGSTVVGTTGYMPPEQLTGRAVPASDLYGLGATVIHLITHVHPSKLPQARLRLSWRERANCPDTFATWIDRLVAPVVEDRFSSAASARAELSDSAVAPPTVASTMLTAGPADHGLAQRNEPPEGVTAYIEDGDLMLHFRDGFQEFGKLLFIAALPAAAIAWAATGNIMAGVGMLLAFFVVAVSTGTAGGQEKLSVAPDGSFQLTRTSRSTTVHESGVLVAVKWDQKHLRLFTNTGSEVPVAQHINTRSYRWIAERVRKHVGVSE